MREASDSELVSTRQRRIAQLAKQMPEKGLTSLNQHLDLTWLREAFRRTRKDGAVGVDGQTAADYEQDLESAPACGGDAAGTDLRAGFLGLFVWIPAATFGARRLGQLLEANRAYVVRYADDFVVGFTDDEDARRVLAVLPKRFGKYGLAIHSDKTRLVSFRKPQGERKPPKPAGPGTFDFLGFTHFWARSRKGNWVWKRKTAASRFTRAVRTISQWCRQHRHDPIEEQHAVLCQKLRGHAGYYGIVGNSPALARFYHAVLTVWRKWLMRRRRAWRVSWDWFRQLLTRYPVPYLRTVQSSVPGVANG